LGSDVTGEQRRIAFILPNLGGGGAERVALTLMRAFVAREFAVDLVLVQATGELLEQLPPEVQVIDLGARRYARALLPLVRYLRRRKPDAIQVRMWPLTVIAIVARMLARTRTRVVVSDHVPLGVMYRDQPRALQAIRATTRLFYPRADARIFVSGGAADDLARLAGLPRDSFEIIHNPIPPAPEVMEIPPEVEQRWGDAGQRIVSVGTLKAVKNFPLLIDAFALLRRQRPTARLMIVGTGPLLESLQSQVAMLDLTEAVIFAGFMADPSPFYASADLFALASNYEGFGNVLVEALRQGTPVVSTDCESGPREILDGGRYGALVPCGDAEALAAAMIATLDRPPDAATLKQRAETLSGGNTIERYLALLLAADQAVDHRRLT
jgi:glycosyltransferase involved in cell wall biosynthesis